MGIIRTQSIKNSINTYIGVFVGAINTILVFPFVFESHPEYWGLLQLLVSYAIIASSFCHFGAPSIIVRFFPKSENKGSLLSFAMILNLIGLLSFLILFLVFKDSFFEYKDSNPLLKSHFYLILILVFCISFFEIFNSLSKSFLDSTTPVFLNEVVLRLFTLVLLVLYHYQFIDFSLFLYAYISAYFLKLLILFFIQWQKNRMTLQFSWQKNMVLNQLKYGFYVISGGGAAVLVSRLDIIMIEHYLDLEQVAYYGLAFFIASVIKVPARSVSSISAPLIAKALQNNNFEEIKSIYTKSSINLFLIGAFIFLCIWLNINEILEILPEKFQAGKMVILYVGLAQLFNLITGVNGLIIINSTFFKFDMYLNLLLLALTVFTNMLLIPLYGINGAALATAISILIYNFVKLIIVKIKMNVHPFSMTTIKSSLLILGIFSLVSLIPLDSFHNVIAIFLRITLISILFLLVVVFFKISDDILQVLDNVYSKYFR